MKKFIVGVLFVTLCFSLVACSAPDTKQQSNAAAGDTEETKVSPSSGTQSSTVTSVNKAQGAKIGVTFDTLENPVWAELLKIAKEYAAELGMGMTYVGCNGDIATQISQIENFIQSKVDAIIVCAPDPAALVDVTKKAMDEGIYVVSYTRDLENTHVNYTADFVAIGYELGCFCADWINKNFANEEKVEFAALTIRTRDRAVRQSDAMIAGVTDNAPNAVLVADADTTSPTAEVGMSDVENIMQAHPNVKAIISIGAYGGVGGNEALKTILKPDQYDSFGLFSIDATEEECLNILRRDPQKGSVSLGSGGLHGRTLVDICYKLLNGEDVDKMYYMEPLRVDITNVQEYYDEVYGKK